MCAKGFKCRETIYTLQRDYEQSLLSGEDKKSEKKIDSSELRGTLGVRLRVLRGVVTTLS